ncbi:NADH:ubiquinone reductase (Na(+)-transporting) subunit B, partial [Psychromonas aquatilis]
VREGIDLKRMMIFEWLATFPAMFYGMYNTGEQANEAIVAGYSALEDWRLALLNMFGVTMGSGAGLFHNF